MKIATLAAVVALATGSAFAAGNTSYDNHSAAPSHSTAANDNTHSGGGLLDKTKRALHRMGDKIRSATHHASNSAHKSEADRQAQSSSDTRSMGAAGSDAQDSGRQRRMDEAYNDWQKKQNKR